MTVHTDLNRLARRLGNLNRNLPRNLNLLKREVALTVQEDLIDATPVKTGHARTNWRIYDAQVNPEEIPIPASIQQGETSAMQQGAQAVQGIQAGNDIYIINSARHISMLNRGWSVQAPANFVRIALRSAVDAINQRTIRIVELE